MCVLLLSSLWDRTPLLKLNLMKPVVEKIPNWGKHCLQLHWWRLKQVKLERHELLLFCLRPTLIFVYSLTSCWSSTASSYYFSLNRNHSSRTWDFDFREEFWEVIFMKPTQPRRRWRTSRFPLNSDNNSWNCVIISFQTYPQIPFRMCPSFQVLQTGYSYLRNLFRIKLKQRTKINNSNRPFGIAFQTWVRLRFIRLHTWDVVRIAYQTTRQWNIHTI